MFTFGTWHQSKTAGAGQPLEPCPKSTPLTDNFSLRYLRGEDGDSGQSDISRRDIIYADLQLPKSSNDGSLRKVRHEGHLPLHDQRHLSVSNGNEPAGTEYAEIRLLPKVDGQVDIWGTFHGNSNCFEISDWVANDVQ